MKECFFGDRIVLSSEMKDIESRAALRGDSASILMDRAGYAIAEILLSFEPSYVYLLVGCGNNGGDAFTAGIELIKRGVKVLAISLYPIASGSSLCKERREKFLLAGGSICALDHEKSFSFSEVGVIVDGIVGTGFKGVPDSMMERVISLANASGMPIVAIDIPSGLHGDTGDVPGICIRADATIYLGRPKWGFFLGQGYEYIGLLKKGEIGLKDEDDIASSKSACLFDSKGWKEELPHFSRTQHKYARGYLTIVAGSLSMAGAAILCSHAAFRAGCGIVRLFHDRSMKESTASNFPELIKTPLTSTVACIKEVNDKAQALVIGPGWGRGFFVALRFKKIIKKVKKPLLIDADGLYLLGKKGLIPPKQAILTPHHGELAYLIERAKGVEGKPLFDLVQAYVDRHEVMILLKGAPTIFFEKDKAPLIMPLGNRGMATAGSGDVLSGIIGGLLAQGMSPRYAAIVGAHVHGEAGQLAKKEKGERSLMASDLLNTLSQVYTQTTSKVGQETG